MVNSGYDSREKPAPTRHRMKITSTRKNGRRAWRLDLGKRDGERERTRKFFPTKTAAEQWFATRRADVRTYGEEAVQFLHAMTPAQRVELVHQLNRLRTMGHTVRSAADALEQRRSAGPSIDIRTAADRFLAAKGARGLRPRSLAKLRSSMRVLCQGVGSDRPLRDVTTGDVRDVLDRNGWAVSTRKGCLGDFGTFFAYCRRHEWIDGNPCARIETPILDKAPPGILTLNQAKTLVNACQADSPSLLGFLVVALFAGMRPAEVLRLSWEDVRPEGIFVEPHKAKTRRHRIVEADECLAAWLAAAREAGAEFRPPNWQARWDALRKRCGLYAGWSQNALRHSFASYRLALHGEDETARLMGNSPQMLVAHYRKPVTRAEAVAFFALRPDPGLLAEGLKVEAARRAAEAAALAAHLDTIRPRRGRPRGPTSPAPPLPVGDPAPGIERPAAAPLECHPRIANPCWPPDSAPDESPDSKRVPFPGTRLAD